MTVNPNAIKELPMMSPGRRTLCLGEPVAHVALVRPVRAQHVVAWAWIHPWVRLHSAEDSAAEFWETLSYAVLWLCGLIGIALCVL